MMSFKERDKKKSLKVSKELLKSERKELKRRF